MPTGITDNYLIDMGSADHMADALSARAEYHAFLERKTQCGADSGFAPLFMPDSLFPFQSHLANYAIRGGRRALFADCGLGKTALELTFAENVMRHANKPVLLLDTLAVSPQTVREGEKFGVSAKQSRDGTVYRDAVTVTNYEQLHRFDWKDFGGVVCDEASILKSFDGATRTAVTEFMRKIPYRLLATATPAPNDYIELGTSSEALGFLGHMDMLARFFKNDRNTCDTRTTTRRAPAMGGPVSSGWRFKGHAEIPFLQFVTSWARACRRPSDLGFSDDGFVLPELIERDHMVESSTLAPGKLFATVATNMREEREERRRTLKERCEKAAELAQNGEPFVIWCQLNDEGDLLEELLRGHAVQVSGSDADESKEEKYLAFASGQSRGIISKQKLGGWGLNWQHCAHVIEFATHSYEAHYQGVRRCWRFGQKNTVTNDVIYTEGQRAIKDNMRRKAEQADRMFTSLVAEMNHAAQQDKDYNFTQKAELPSWL